MPHQPCIAVLTTVGTQADARRIAQALVEQKLVACAQISPIESFYVWNGAVQNEPEYRLLLKTTAERYDAVEAATRAMHPYESCRRLARWCLIGLKGRMRSGWRRA